MDSFFRFHKFHKNQEKNFKTKKDFLDLCRISTLKAIESTNKMCVFNLCPGEVLDYVLYGKNKND
ncbi:MAG: hypothetical protein PWP18_450 [Thermoanaerobacter sp.]|jgi:hypothetical protein|nr:hypothetical protein [Thermoanaerobacter sp.]